MFVTNNAEGASSNQNSVSDSGFIMIEVLGGLGNQMFQYAAGAALAKRLGLRVLLDLRAFNKYSLRSFLLNRWRISAREAADRELRQFPLWLGKVARRLQPLGIQTGYHYELSIGYHPFAVAGNKCRIAGYFQSEEYFSDSREFILREFTLSEMLLGANLRISKHIEDTQSVSIHVRRGDYVSDPRARLVHGVCDITYYQSAIDEISSACSGATFFLFSDDMDWAKQNIRVPGELVCVEGNESRPEIDIYLMSLCRHNICANSSFSWWGAWLNRHEGKHVIVPRRWFASSDLNSTHLIPAGWHALG